MKNMRHPTTNDAMDNRMKLSNHQTKVPKSKLSTGSVVGLFPVVLDGGRTIIYISDKSREPQIRSQYALRK
ncbi:MAG: hypothetical protein NT040_03620 [Bacteroidetes bacterium]|nr:hypothetical protein [Bacteroidota bacterium]